MSQCHERFYRKLKVTLVLNNVTIEEIAAISKFLKERRQVEATIEEIAAISKFLKERRQVEAEQKKAH